jgi:hypothetical protein
MGLRGTAQRRHEHEAEAVRVGDFWGRVMPEALAGPGQQLGADWNLWGFRFDDLRSEADLDDSQQLIDYLHLVNRLQMVVESTAVHAAVQDPHARALQDLNIRLRALGGPVVIRRWEEAHRKWFAAELWQASFRVRGELPTLNEHTMIRAGTSGGQILEVIMEVAEGAEIAATEREAPEVRALSEAGCVIGGFDNDIFSLLKEQARKERPQNLIPVLEQHTGCTQPEALVQAIHLRNQVMVLFVRLRDQVLPTASPALGRYLANVGHMIRGNLDWSLTTPRYTTQPVIAAITHDPSGIDPAPPPIPAIAWWWNLLEHDRTRSNR